MPDDNKRNQASVIPNPEDLTERDTLNVGKYGDQEYMRRAVLSRFGVDPRSANVLGNLFERVLVPMFGGFSRLRALQNGNQNGVQPDFNDLLNQFGGLGFGGLRNMAGNALSGADTSFSKTMNDIMDADEQQGIMQQLLPLLTAGYDPMAAKAVVNRFGLLAGDQRQAALEGDIGRGSDDANPYKYTSSRFNQLLGNAPIPAPPNRFPGSPRG